MVYSIKYGEIGVNEIRYTTELKKWYNNPQPTTKTKEKRQ